MPPTSRFFSPGLGSRPSERDRFRSSTQFGGVSTLVVAAGCKPLKAQATAIPLDLDGAILPRYHTPRKSAFSATSRRFRRQQLSKRNLASILARLWSRSSSTPVTPSAAH